jgi:hypothetical protein
VSIAPKATKAPSATSQANRPPSLSSTWLTLGAPVAR